LKKHHIRPEQFNYTSKYYPKSRNLQSKLWIFEGKSIKYL
jgi:hypothetical protein